MENFIIKLDVDLTSPTGYKECTLVGHCDSLGSQNFPLGSVLCTICHLFTKDQRKEDAMPAEEVTLGGGVDHCGGPGSIEYLAYYCFEYNFICLFAELKGRRGQACCGSYTWWWCGPLWWTWLFRLFCFLLFRVQFYLVVCRTKGKKVPGLLRKLHLLVWAVAAALALVTIYGPTQWNLTKASIIKE